MFKNLNKSDKKFIRLEKARIRRKFWDVKKQKEMIDEMYKRLSGEIKAEVIEKKVKKVKVEQKQNQVKSKAKAEKGKMKNKKKAK
ncbi:MAG: hypothetical protein A2360_02430 [Candidatus Staskawiczbacteria bacterium RIFOXYB1_FULL_32_11]|uniref:Uncharacterized protein n=1 Tax=Candidatus Staskawiczbacteria bacterium RIFOXYD1_FULL_32_13 TaxID=1802234 RepID=A0A1G2JPN0_9BACT|nr:MAG: hypothetical protein UR22_C0030G0009 [Parcubacteria group bacterium GW2011_GWC2_32_10]OGZ79447.1 MAG: hypothetical protein A2360_02430 [Candidatus Staskawiczbacteria bacterium RIFOXYB1_FULL_32_11]OGZ87621.1 MAG: hypothetical protein A2463_01130 [Candidatus Staskawiczbacteria bacterium RIFOXYC2_FULL_32_10]OGZ89097.1 MAG: hypothetical protein A2561_04100 [Candidatus Staskawiczbacteria bacterium RIFOXYD1_FULL_32_13]